MRTLVHQAGGLAVAIAACAVGVPTVIGASMYFGASAPDWMEMPRWKGGYRFSIIPHRTLTHWPVPWIALILYAMYLPHDAMLLSQILIGFSIGALLHIVMDSMTPMGVPVFVPWHRYGFAMMAPFSAVASVVLVGAGHLR